ncbi:HRDC domain-containing protein [Shewanella aestuarii]|uniref:HRDC domain-containing protein n=1 Tax=Shewanella aestuarii TaxID=1028752 RepID=A0A6G9QQ08_9GAMM|nr:HRDC domain-containing protein [Shewanella aestuarii]QIR16552.1 hypothetical protein HBH39_18935 [Shewanella aestuarii]
MASHPSLKYLLKKAFNICTINNTQQRVLSGVAEHGKYLISGARYDSIDEVVFAQLIALGKQSIVISNSIDDMMRICQQLSTVNVFANYIHGQLSDVEVEQRIEGFKACDISILFITPDQAIKGHTLSSAIDLDHSVTVVILNAEKFAADHLHHSPIYDELHCHIAAIELELSTQRKQSFECPKVYVGYTLSKHQIIDIIQQHRLHNAQYSVLDYAFGHLVLESICVKNVNAMLRECAHICTRGTKAIVVVNDKRTGETFFNELSKHANTLSVLGNTSNKEGAMLIAKFAKMKSGILVTNRYSHISDSQAETVVLAQFPLSASHLCSILGAGSNQTGSIKSAYILYRENVSFNHAIYELNCKFPTSKDYQTVIDCIIEAKLTQFDKGFIFSASKQTHIPAQSIFRIMDKLSTLSFLKKTVFFDKGFQSKFDVVNLQRTLPKSINWINESVNKQLADLQSILQTHGCKTQALNTLLGASDQVSCGKCSVCHQSTGNERWNNRVNRSTANDAQEDRQKNNISNQLSHQLYRNPYSALSSDITEDYDREIAGTFTRHKQSSVDLNLNDPIETQLCILRKTVAKRLNIPELSVFNDTTLKLISDLKPQNIHQLNAIEGFYGSQRAAVFGKEIINIIRVVK